MKGKQKKSIFEIGCGEGKLMEKCVVIIPALNEEKTIGQVIRAIPETLFDGRVKVDVIVINDGSTDRTAKIAEEQGAFVIQHKSPQGVGASFSAGVKEALIQKTDYAVNIDADGQMNPEDIEKLLKPIVGGAADMVTASRFKDKELIPQMPKIKRWGNHKVAQIVSSIVGRKYYDVSCGFRAYNRETLLRLNLRGKFTYTQETFISLANNNHIRIEEVPVKIQGEREFGKSRVASSILKYGIRSGSIILSAFKNYQPVRFFGGLSLCFLLVGIIFEAVFLGHYVIYGFFRNYLWAGLTGAFMAIVAMLFLTLMIVSDTLGKMVKTEEEILYFSKLQFYYGMDNKDGSIKAD